MTRTKIGISGLDELLDGGIVKGSSVLLAGRSGSGKTIFGLQFLYYGAMKCDEPGLIVTFESRPDELRDEALQFGWDLRALENQGKFTIIDAASSKAMLPSSEEYALKRGFDIATLSDTIYKVINDTGAQRVVIDCLSGLGIRYTELSEVRNAVYQISALLRHMKVTSLLITETNSPMEHSRAGVEQFLTQGLIVLNLEETDSGLERSLVIWKMRQTSHSLKKHPFVIGKTGIQVKSAR